jgi:chromosome segregation ATPase
MSTAASDPYYVAREEVEKRLTQFKNQGKRWETLYQGNTARSREFSEIQNALLSQATELEKDIKEMEGAVKAVERAPQRFPHCTPYELEQRRLWVSNSRKGVKLVVDRLNSPGVLAKIDADRRKYDQEILDTERTRKQAESENQNKIDKTKHLQKQIIAKQDQDLTDLANATSRLGEAAIVINMELHTQERMLNDLDNEVDRQREKMNFVMRKTAQLLNTDDTKQICMVLSLTGLCALLFFINIYF